VKRKSMYLEPFHAVSIGSDHELHAALRGSVDTTRLSFS
jgi:hypothetical protein